MDSFAITEGVAAQERQESQSDPVSNKLSEETNKFQQAIAAWRGIDLASTIAKLDTTASEIVEHQRDSIVQRKDLAQKTKDFRKLDDEAKIGEFKGLLKAYQSFIDVLTNQGKASSSSFLQLYSSLSEAPDPYPLLEASVDSLVLSEDTVPKLTSERDQLQKSVDRLTRQQEETEKRLQEERAARKKLDENQETRAKEIEASWEAVLSEKTNNWTAKEKSLEEKVENQDRLIKELKASYEVSQRMGEDDEQDGARSGATAAELELVSADLEKTSLRLADVEARNEQMRLELAQAASHSNSDKPASVEEDPSYLRLQSENSSLLRKLDAARYDKDSTRHTWEGKVLQAERNATKATTERDELRSRLDKLADYDDIRRELDMLRSIELTAGDDEDIGDAVEGNATDAGGDAIKSNGQNSLEQLLLARNKKLTDELAILRVSTREAQEQLEGARKALATTKEELEKSRGLSTTLENDLLQVQQEAANAFPSSAMSVAGTYTSRYPHSARRGASSPTSSIISGFDQSTASSNTMDAIRAGEAVGGGSGLLPMIQAQRDRFKKKNAELEEELSKLYATVKSLRQEVASLQKDNLGLYEKTRYVSTYSRGQGASASASASSYANAPSSASVYNSSNTSSGLSLDRYQSAYEAKISPFAAFRGRESARAYKRMNLPERIVFSLTRIIMANRTSRNLFAGYCFALHLLLFVMLYMMSTTEIEKHSAMSAVGSAAAAAYSNSGGPVGSGSGSSGSSGQLHADDWQQEGFAT